MPVGGLAVVSTRSRLFVVVDTAAGLSATLSRGPQIAESRAGALQVCGSSALSEMNMCRLCSAGVGRSGTFIALDALLEQAEHQDTIDVLEFAYRMR